MENKEWTEGLTPEATLIVEAYVDSGGVDFPDVSATVFEGMNEWTNAKNAEHLAAGLSRVQNWNKEEKLCMSFLFKLWENRVGHWRFLDWFRTSKEEEVLAVAKAMEQPPTMANLAKSIWTFTYHLDARILRENATPDNPFASPFANIAWRHLDPSGWRRLSFSDSGFLTAIGRWHSKGLVDMLSNDPELVSSYMLEGMAAFVIKETDSADDLFVMWAEQNLIVPYPDPSSWRARPDARNKAFYAIKKLSALRNDRYHDLVLRLALLPEFALNGHAIDVLLSHRPDIALDTIGAAIDESDGSYQSICNVEGGFTRLIRFAITDIAGRGGPFLRKVLAKGSSYYTPGVIKQMLEEVDSAHAEIYREIILTHAASHTTTASVLCFWRSLSDYDKGLLLPEWKSHAKGKSKPMRTIACYWLLKHQVPDILSDLDRLLGSEAANDRLAGISLLATSATPADLDRLQSMHRSEATKQVRVTIAAVLSKHGITVPPEQEKQVETVRDMLTLESLLLKRAKTIRLPKAPWLDLDALPSLKTTDGQELSKLATTHIFQCQARAKPGMIAPEVEVLLPHLSRGGNPGFARLLLDQWFASDMNSATRWALDMVGITGDDSVIKHLIEPIPAWCKANHGPRAGWVIHALSLIASEKAMAALDELSQKFRTKRAYVGKAAAIAMESVATNLGISKDELSERLVSTCGFNSTGSREFEVIDGNITAQLDLDFKIAWMDPDSGHLLNKPPALLTPTAEAELKDVRKAIKQAVSLQIARLQDAMIIGRRWEIITWRMRFEHHPLYRIFAMRLVWGTYDEAGTLLGTFRLYPNGLAASASGMPEEFAAPVMNIGIVHPLDLDEGTRQEWSQHLARFKIKPAFPQIARPTHALDPLHGNRKELRETDEVNTSAGNIRSTLFARGWVQESPGDGGYINYMLRMFPTCGVLACLRVEDLHAGSSNHDEVMLGVAFFAREPINGSSDFDTLRFDQVPPVVFSETISDLKAIIATKE